MMSGPHRLSVLEKTEDAASVRIGTTGFGLGSLDVAARETADAAGVDTKAPRILLVGALPLPLGGVTVHIARLAAMLSRRGYIVRLLDESPIFKPDVPNIRRLNPFAYLRLLWTSDALHIHSSNAFVKLGHVLAGRLLGCRVVTTIHSSHSGFSVVVDRVLYRLACRLSHGAILVSPGVRDALQARGDVIPAFLPPAAAEEIVPAGIADWIAARRQEGRRIVVSNASDLRTMHGVDLYGLDMLLDAFARPDVQRDHALVFVVSSVRFGAERFDAAVAQIEQRGLASVIHLVRLDAPFAGIVRATDVVVRATNTDGDAVTVREALWYGKRVLASDCVARPEGCELFRSRDVDDLARALLAPAPVDGLRDARLDTAATIEGVYRRAGIAVPARVTTPPFADAARRRVLVISQFYTPDITAAAFRVSETVALMRAGGFDVRVIAAEPHKAQSVSAPTASPIARDDTIRVPIRAYRGGGASSYLAHYLSFVSRAIWAGIGLRRGGWRADVIWVTSPPLFVGLAGDVLAHVMRCPMVLDVRDIWPESAVGAGMMRAGGLLFRVGKLLERWVYMRSARLTCVSRTMQDYLAAASGKPVAVVYNGVGAALAAGRPAAKIQRRILYAGNIGRAQGLDALIKAFADARRQSPALTGWTVDLLGAGAMETDLRLLTADLGVADAVRFRGVVDKPAAFAEARASAALFVNLVDNAAFALTVPSKVFDCMLAGRPILYGVGGVEARAILAESGGNRSFQPSDVASLTAAMIEVAERLPAFEAAALGNAAIVQSRYTREAATETLIATLEAAMVPALGRVATAVGAFRRTLAFARHIPPRRVLRRAELFLKRRWLQRFGATTLPAPGDCQPATLLPRPLLPPRGDLTTGRDGRLSTTLIGRPMPLDAKMQWTSPDGVRGDQLRFMTLNYMEYLEGADDDQFAALVGSWLDADTAHGRGFFSETHNSYAVSQRTVVWMQQLARRTALPAALRARMLQSLARQLQFLARNLETDIGGNHLIKNIKALLWGSVVFEGTAPRLWRETGLELLAKELGQQVLADGMHYERSPSYHAQVFVDLMEIRHVLGADPFAGRLDRTLALMAQAVADLTHGDGHPAQVNDAGLTMSYTPADALDAYARLFGTRPAQRTQFAYRDAGYFGCAVNGGLLLADCGRIGPDDLPGHGHGDVLSFEWSIAGRRVIVDQGVYEYVAGPRRAAARAAASHNTLSIAGLDQADFFADFRVGRRPAVTVHRYETTQQGFLLEGSHDGYAPLRPVRTIEMHGQGLVISDRLEGVTARSVRTALLLHPDVTVTGSWPDMRLIAGPTCVRVRSSVPLVVEAAVWWPDLGVELATQRLVAHWPADVTAATLALTLE